MIKQLLFSIFTSVILSLSSYGQDSLICMVDNQLISVSQINAGVTNYIPLTGIPAGFSDLRISWATPHHCYYAIANSTSGNDEIVRIDPWGNWANMGQVSVPGQTVYNIEGIAFNPADNGLYVSASLNGASSGDWWSESLLKVNIATMEGTIIGTFSHTGTVYEAEADMIAFSPNGTLYYNDTEPGGPEFKYILEQDLAFSNPPVLLHEEYYTQGAVNGITFKDDKVYFIVDRDLREIDVNTGIHSNVGTMFSSAAYSNEVPTGLTWITKGAGTASVDQEEQKGVVLNIYPNPTKGQINIQIENSYEIQELRILNVLGKEIQQINSIQDQMTLELSGSNGLYYLEATSFDGSVKTSKVIKQ